MSKLFNKTNDIAMSPKQKLEARYNSSINNLLLVVALTVINVVLLVTDSDTYFLFSAFIPYALADFGKYLCGMYPEDYYSDVEEFEFLDSSFFVIMMAAIAVILLLYLLCWFLAKKKKVGWLIFALIFFAVDTATMLFFMGINMEMFMDILIHIWVIGYLINAVVAYNQWKKTPEEVRTAVDEFITQDYPQAPVNSATLRMADTDVNSKIFLEAEAFGHHIVYRRVKTTNELVIDGRVYDEYVAFLESTHNLVAVIDGHKFEAGSRGVNCYIRADGEYVAKKLRIV